MDDLGHFKKPRRRLSDAQVVEMRELRAAGATVAELAERFGASVERVRALCCGSQRAEAGGPFTANPRAVLAGFKPKVTAEQVRAMREAREAGATYRELAQRFGLHHKAVQRICVGRARANAGGPLQPRRPSHTSTIGRCPECGARVFLPCLLCDLKAGRVKPLDKSELENLHTENWRYHFPGRPLPK